MSTIIQHPALASECECFPSSTQTRSTALPSWFGFRREGLSDTPRTLPQPSNLCSRVAGKPDYRVLIAFATCLLVSNIIVLDSNPDVPPPSCIRISKEGRAAIPANARPISPCPVILFQRTSGKLLDITRPRGVQQATDSDAARVLRWESGAGKEHQRREPCPTTRPRQTPLSSEKPAGTRTA